MERTTFISISGIVHPQEQYKCWAKNLIKVILIFVSPLSSPMKSVPCTKQKVPTISGQQYLAGLEQYICPIFTP